MDSHRHSDVSPWPGLRFTSSRFVYTSARSQSVRLHQADSNVGRYDFPIRRAAPGRTLLTGRSVALPFLSRLAAACRAFEDRQSIPGSHRRNSNGISVLGVGSTVRAGEVASTGGSRCACHRRRFLKALEYKSDSESCTSHPKTLAQKGDHLSACCGLIKSGFWNSKALPSKPPPARYYGTALYRIQIFTSTARALVQEQQQAALSAEPPYLCLPRKQR